MEIVLLYSYLHIQMRTKRGERLKTQAYYWIPASCQRRLYDVCFLLSIFLSFNYFMTVTTTLL
jgi:hypothetical protein